MSETSTCPTCGGVVTGEQCPHCQGATNQPAGMYPDPETPGQMRYWDGAEWAAPGQKPPTNWKAPVALVMSLLFWPLTGFVSLLYFFWASLPRPVVFLVLIAYWVTGVALGVAGLRQARRQGRSPGVAIAALVILGLFAFYLVYILVT